ncbi:MAG: hypothetical protein JXA44_03160 [Methanospirillaceae archaeon]|nr:hypothetical protein [Methanospirillaceae archaeon]
MNLTHFWIRLKVPPENGIFTYDEYHGTLWLIDEIYNEKSFIHKFQSMDYERFFD